MSKRNEDQLSRWDVFRDHWYLLLMGAAGIFAALTTAALGGYEELPVAGALLLGGVGSILFFAYLMRRWK